ncbi:MAG: hypothetical protein GXO15_02150 [Crenarchaeota archaeon]|nr:hypothetical protein [Thermoproteota archaeon]
MKAIYTLAMAAILLAIVGAAYAAWTETLRIEATVKTGELDVAFDENSLQVTDTGADPQADGYDNGEDFDVAQAYLQPLSHDDEGDLVALNFTLNNTYPGYTACAEFNITNIGSIPARITDINVTVDDTTYTYEDYVNNNEKIELYDGAIVVKYNMTVGEVLEAKKEKSYKVCVEVTEKAQELQEYAFTVIIEFTQWNVVENQEETG